MWDKNTIWSSHVDGRNQGKRYIICFLPNTEVESWFGHIGSMPMWDASIPTCSSTCFFTTPIPFLISEFLHILCLSLFLLHCFRSLLLYWREWQEWILWFVPDLLKHFFSPNFQGENSMKLFRLTYYFFSFKLNTLS